PVRSTPVVANKTPPRTGSREPGLHHSGTLRKIASASAQLTTVIAAPTKTQISRVPRISALGRRAPGRLPPRTRPRSARLPVERRRQAGLALIRRAELRRGVGVLGRAREWGE